MHTAEDLLAEGLAQLGFGDELARQMPLLNRYADELLLFNSAYNLVGAKTREEIIVNHLLDSLSAAHEISNLAGDSPLIGDIGSGGGLPGIPLAIALPHVRFVLVERMAKRCTFLENCVAVLHLQNVRIENREIERLDRNCFDVCTFRAFRPLDRQMTVQLLSLLRPNGFLAAYKAKRSEIDSEMRAIADVVPEYAVQELSVPFLAGHERNLVIIQTKQT